MFPTYYSLLGVAEDADDKAIRAAYRRLIRRFHPDIHPNDSTAAKRARQLNRAVEVLTDPGHRRRYDEKIRRKREAAASTQQPEQGNAGNRTRPSGRETKPDTTGRHSQTGSSGRTSSDMNSTSSGDFGFTDSARRRRKSENPFVVVRRAAGVVLGGIAGLVIGSMILWVVRGLDPLGIISPFVQTTAQQNNAEVKSKVNMPAPTRSPNEKRVAPSADSESGQQTEKKLEENESLRPSDGQVADIPKVKVPDKVELSKAEVPDVEVSDKKTAVDQMENNGGSPGDLESLDVEIVDAIKAFSNSSRTATVVIPAGTKRVEIGMIGANHSKKSITSRYPGFRGILKVNDSPVVVFNRKYTWRGDGKSYGYCVGMDGKDVNTRDAKGTVGTFDITRLVEPGEKLVINYSHKQRHPTGVRVYFYRESEFP